jgi:hypothetical protein
LANHRSPFPRATLKRSHGGHVDADRVDIPPAPQLNDARIIHVSANCADPHISTLKTPRRQPYLHQLCRRRLHLGEFHHVKRRLCRSHRKLYESLRLYKCVALAGLRWSTIRQHRIRKSKLQYNSSNFQPSHLLQACKIHQSKTPTADQVLTPNNQHEFHQANSRLFWCNRSLRWHYTRSSAQRWLQLFSPYAILCPNILTMKANISLKSLVTHLSFTNSWKKSTKYQSQR